MKDEFLVLLKDRLGIGAGGIDPEFEHAARAGKRAWNLAIALEFARIANIDNHDIVALRRLDRLKRAQRLDFGIGLIDEGLDAAMDGLGHVLRLRFSCSPSFRG